MVTESDPGDDAQADALEEAPTDPARADGALPDEALQDESPVDPLEAAKEDAKKLRDQLLRTAADFDNFRKRTRREITEADRHGREELLRELLPVFDNLERAVAHAEIASEVGSLTEGIRMVMRQFADTLGRLSIERVQSDGASFDPSVHEAIQQIETEDHPPGTITAEVQAGYKMGDRLVRPAMVVVAKAPVVAPDPGSPVEVDSDDEASSVDESE